MAGTSSDRIDESALPKKRLHDLVDRLSEHQVEPVERYLTSLCNEEDPVIAAARTAPLDDEEITDEDREDIAEGQRDIAAGRFISDDQLRRKLRLLGGRSSGPPAHTKTSPHSNPPPRGEFTEHVIASHKPDTPTSAASSTSRPQHGASESAGTA